ncbi:hypothetical protein RDABS01_008284 [Bienertia sinuspersici]
MDLFSAIFTFIASAIVLILTLILALIIKIYSGKSIRSLNYPPVDGTVFHQLFYFNRLYDHQTGTARKHPTFRLLAPDQSEFYTTDVRNIEHILKTSFDKYAKGKYNRDILRDLFGEGIFAIDGDRWKQQRKLASFEFSTRISKANDIFDIHIRSENFRLDQIRSEKFRSDQKNSDQIRKY